ncbi:TPA: hypothetical protein PJ672_002039 [Staphylococcus aureus]|nr:MULTISPECIES: hypothetical protein [Staphylococcus]AGO28459.1 hypothetical protein CA347_80 [Staphylococcus aureus CA-347]ENL47432.1 hypothetical protein B466_00457 [Staphylococcus aureus M0877]ENM80146.1 hypothetical protein U7O_00440 [Staphylococcus aureus M1311]EUF24096.1 hypothetical protein O714_01356 [Staphylococcus aureus M0715]EUV88092.1 hypothetical protein O390_02024 [Staphylococcus aureus M0236]EVK04031.1 hypothetical protein O805_01909 [Staphylococcus aureus M0777]EVM38818.1 h
MLSTAYFYVSIQYFTNLSEADELKKLLFKMKIIDQNREYLYDREIDELSKHDVSLELSADGTIT